MKGVMQLELSEENKEKGERERARARERKRDRERERQRARESERERETEGIDLLIPRVASIFKVPLPLVSPPISPHESPVLTYLLTGKTDAIVTTVHDNQWPKLSICLSNKAMITD